MSAGSLFVSARRITNLCVRHGHPSSFAAKERTRASPDGLEDPHGAFPANETAVAICGVRLAGEFSEIPQLAIRIGVARKEATRQFLRETVRMNLLPLQPGRESIHVAGRQDRSSRTLEESEIGPQTGLAPYLKRTNEKLWPTEILDFHLNISHSQRVSQRSIETDRTDRGEHRLKGSHSFAAGIDGKVGKRLSRRKKG